MDLLIKVFSFKMKEINLKITKYKKQNTLQKKKKKKNHKVKFLTTKKTKVVRQRPIIIIFQWPLKIEFDKKSYQNNKLLIFRLYKLTKISIKN